MENKFCQWCSNPKNWLHWLIGAVVIMLVFCAGIAAGRFSTLYRSGQRGGFERGGFQQGGYGRQMMRGERNYRNFAPSNINTVAPAGQNDATNGQNTAAPTTTAPAK